jgi:hypothetical protein
MAWAGWGAGPAGAGSAGGPSRLFLLVACLGAGVVTLILALDRSPAALLSGGAAVYFGLRLGGRLGPRNPT